jgi:S-DNA-T family DNA segregation ATPase FtsK/SpoIIIE
MIDRNCLSFLSDTFRDDRNIVNKRDLSKFIEENYCSGKVENVVNGISVTRYDIKVSPKQIKYFLKLERSFNAFFDTNDCRLGQDGKYVFCEVPNKYRGLLSLKDGITRISEMPFNPSNLLFSLGEKIDGEPLIADLKDMPHLLIAGQTGSGKSVFLHSLILSLLAQHNANEIQFLLVDTKKVELGFYRNLQQVRDIATTPEKAMIKLREMCDEMDRRYEILADAPSNLL